jgi:hypothetical protein
LRLDRNGVGAAAQLAPVGIEGMVGKKKTHAGTPTWTAMPSSQGTLKPISSTNQAPVKVFWSRSPYPLHAAVESTGSFRPAIEHATQGNRK